MMVSKQDLSPAFRVLPSLQQETSALRSLARSLRSLPTGLSLPLALPTSSPVDNLTVNTSTRAEGTMYPINTYSSQVSPYTAPYPDSPLVVSPLQISAPPSHFSHGHSLPPSPLDTSSPSWLSSHRLEYSPYGRVASFKPASSPNGSSSSHASDDASDESEGRESEEEKQINEEEAGVTQKEPQEEATAELVRELAVCDPLSGLTVSLEQATGKAPVSMPFVRKLRELLRHEELYSDILRWECVQRCDERRLP